jgi:uncharacterized protein YlxW (UPF0749 family)
VCDEVDAWTDLDVRQEEKEKEEKREKEMRMLREKLAREEKAREELEQLRRRLEEEMESERYAVLGLQSATHTHTQRPFSHSARASLWWRLPGAT